MKGVFDVTFQSALDVFNYGLVLIYGLFLSVSIAGGCTEKRDKKLVALLCPVFLVLQSLFALTLGTDKTMQLYPLIVHLPLVLILTLALKKPLGVAVVSTCTAYLCCQPLRWGFPIVEALYKAVCCPSAGSIVAKAKGIKNSLDSDWVKAVSTFRPPIDGGNCRIQKRKSGAHILNVRAECHRHLGRIAHAIESCSYRLVVVIRTSGANGTQKCNEYNDW